MPHLVPAVLVLEGVKYCRGYSVFPNIWGQLTDVHGGNYLGGNGALSVTANGQVQDFTASGTNRYGNATFLASENNNLYGKSSTVQVDAVYCQCLIRYA